MIGNGFSRLSRVISDFSHGYEKHWHLWFLGRAVKRTGVVRAESYTHSLRRTEPLHQNPLCKCKPVGATVAIAIVRVVFFLFFLSWSVPCHPRSFWLRSQYALGNEHVKLAADRVHLMGTTEHNGNGYSSFSHSCIDDCSRGQSLAWTNRHFKGPVPQSIINSTQIMVQHTISKCLLLNSLEPGEKHCTCNVLNELI